MTGSAATLTAGRTIEAHQAETAAPESRPSGLVWLDVWCTLVAIGLVAVTALDGSRAWCLVRLAIVVGACTTLARFGRSRARGAAGAALAVGAIATVAAAPSGTRTSRPPGLP